MAATIEIGVAELLLQGKSPSAQTVKVQIKGPADLFADGGKMQTASVPATASQPVRFGWAHTEQFYPGERQWIALDKSLGKAKSHPGAASISFTVINTGASAAPEMGSAHVDLSQLVSATTETPGKHLQVLDSRRNHIGTLVVRVQALDAVQLVRRGGSAGGAASAAAATPGAIGEDVKRAFSLFDKDNSGDIDASELRSALAQLGMDASSSDAQRVLQRYARSGSPNRRGRPTTLTVEDFAKLVSDLRAHKSGGGSPRSPKGKRPATAAPPARGSGDAHIRAAFAEFDKDGSGGIDREEVVEALNQLGLKTSHADAQRVFDKYATPGAREISFAQFERMANDVEQFYGKRNRGASPIRRTSVARSSIDEKVRRAFEEFDADGSGDIDKFELANALRTLGMDASISQAGEIMRKYDKNVQDERLDLFEFARLVRDLETYFKGGEGGGGGGGGRSGGGAAAKGLSDADPAIRKAFKMFDRDSNGKLDAREIVEALRHLGIDADGAQAAQVLRKYDLNRSGGMEVDEFAELCSDIIAFQSGSAASGKGGVPAEVRRAFEYFDADRNGYIDRTELIKALKHLGIDGDESQAAAILRQYDSDSNGQLDLDEFGRLVADIRRFQEGGGKDAIAEQLGREDVKSTLKKHRACLDELFVAFALIEDDDAAGTATGEDASESEIRAAFAAYDRDASGGIDAQELTGALARLGLQASTQQTQRVLARYDTDASRQLELDEFRQLVADLRAFQAGSAAGAGAAASSAARTPRVMGVEELLSLVHCFNLVPACVSETEVKNCVRDMQHVSSTASVALEPFRHESFGEALLRLAHLAAARNEGARAMAAGERLADFLERLFVQDLDRMRVLVGGHRLREACTSGDLETCSVLIRERVAVDSRDHEGWTALQRASAYGHEECVDELIKARASLPQRGPNGFSAMHWACEFGHLAIVKQLLSAGGALADLTDVGWTPLHRAAIDGHVEVVSVLLGEKRDRRSGDTLYPIGARDKHGDTALHDAARNGHLAVVRELVSHKAPLDAPNHAGKTPSDVAQAAGRRDVAELLQQKLRATGGAAAAAGRRK